MPRHYAAISTTIWDDPDFRELTSDAQRAYMMLLSQSTITSVGVVPMTLKRWAGNTKGMTVKGLTKVLYELSAAAFIVVDWEREELLIRTFVKHDGGVNNSLRLKAIQGASKAVTSPLLAPCLAYELDLLGVAHEMPVTPQPGKTDKTDTCRSKGHRSPIEGASKGQGGGYVSTVGTGPSTWNKNLEQGVGTADAGSPATRPHRIPEDFTINASMIEWAKANVPGLDVKRSTTKFVNHWHSDGSAKAKKLNWHRAWQNWMYGDHERLPANHQARPSTTNNRVNEADAAGARLMASLANQMEITR